MPYRLLPTGTIECDSIDEIHLLANGRNGHGSQAAGSVKRSYKKRGRKAAANGTAASWKKAKKIAKRLGRPDIAAVRSEVAAGTLK